MELYSGKPTDERIEKEIRSYDFLDKLDINYERVDHDAADTMQLCLEIDKALNTKICKNLFLSKLLFKTVIIERNKSITITLNK